MVYNTWKVELATLLDVRNNNNGKRNYDDSTAAEFMASLTMFAFIKEV